MDLWMQDPEAAIAKRRRGEARRRRFTTFIGQLITTTITMFRHSEGAIPARIRRVHVFVDVYSTGG